MNRTVDISLYPNLNETMNGWVCVTPNPRAARVRHVASITLESLAIRVLQHQKQALASALQSRKLLQEAVEMNGFRDVEGTARKMEGAIKELFRAGIDCEAIMNRSTLSRRAHSLVETASTYQNLLYENHLIDRAHALQFAAKYCQDKKLCQPICVLGYPRFSIDERIFINAYASEGSQVHLPCGEHYVFGENQRSLNFFKQNEWEVKEDNKNTSLHYGERLARVYLGAGESDENIAAHVYPDEEAEARGVLGQVKLKLDQGVSASQIALASRKESAYGSLLCSVAEEYGVPIRLMYDVTLAETRMGSWILAAFDAIENNFPFEETIRLLGHPLGYDLRGVQFEKQWNHWRREYPSGMQSWQEKKIPTEVLSWPQNGMRHQYIGQFEDLMRWFRLRERCAYWAKESIAFYELQGGLEELKNRKAESISREQFFMEIREMLTVLQAPMHPGRGGIELHTPQAMHGAQFEHVYVMGVVEGVLPAPVKENLVLDFHERETGESFQELESSIDAANREHLSIWTLLKTARQSLTLSYPEIYGGKEALPSVVFRMLDASPQSFHLKAIVSEEELRQIQLRTNSAGTDDALRKARYAWEVETRRETDIQFDRYDGAVEIPIDLEARKFSPSQLLQLGQCPFKWFAGYLLRLEEPEEAELDLTPANRGSLYHKTLQRMLEQTDFTHDPLPQCLNHLEEYFERAETELIEEGTDLTRLPGWESRRLEMLAQLRQAIQSEDYWQAGYVPIYFEQEFDFTWYGLQVRGLIDRIDQGPDGLLLVDYKTSSQRPAGVKDETGAAKWDIQIPIYQAAVENALCPDQRVQNAYYFSLTKAKKLPSPRNQPDYEAFVERVKNALRNGYFPVMPDQGEEACRYCDFDTLCRKGPRLSRKEVEG